MAARGAALAAFTISGGGVFWPYVGQISDLIVVATNQPAASRFGNADLVLGVDLTSVPGPMRPDQGSPESAGPTIFAYQQLTGETAGIDISGAELTEDKATNAALYGKELTNAAILRQNGGGTNPAAVKAFLSALPPPAGQR